MPLPDDTSTAVPIVLVCGCRESSGLTTSKYCPNCGMPRRAQDPATITDVSLSEQLSSSLTELSLLTPVDATYEGAFVSAPVVIPADNWALDNDFAAPDSALAQDKAQTQQAQWRTSQPFNMRAVLLSATTAFTAFAFLFFATSRGRVGAGQSTGAGAEAPVAFSLTASASSNAQSVVIQPNAQHTGAATTTSSITSITGSNGAPISNASAPRHANRQGGSALLPRLPRVESTPQEIAPASISSLPRVASRFEAREDTAPGSNGNSSSRVAVTAVGSDVSGPLQALSSRPTYVNVSPVDDTQDEYAASDNSSRSGRNSRTSGYMIVNGRVVMDSTAPQVTILSPNANGNYVGYFPALQGAANSPAGVADVELEIERMATGSARAAYWDGQDWASRATRLTTTVANGAWSYSGVLPDNEKLVAGYYRVKVYAQGFRGPQRRTSPVASLRIRVFPKGPTD